jgi:hypothetical protein
VAGRPLDSDTRWVVVDDGRLAPLSMASMFSGGAFSSENNRAVVQKRLRVFTHQEFLEMDWPSDWPPRQPDFTVVFVDALDISEHVVRDTAPPDPGSRDAPVLRTSIRAGEVVDTLRSRLINTYRQRKFKPRVCVALYTNETLRGPEADTKMLAALHSVGRDLSAIATWGVFEFKDFFEEGVLRGCMEGRVSELGIPAPEDVNDVRKALEIAREAAKIANSARELEVGDGEREFRRTMHILLVGGSQAQKLPGEAVTRARNWLKRRTGENDFSVALHKVRRLLNVDTSEPYIPRERGRHGTSRSNSTTNDDVG